MPVYELLGGKQRDVIPTFASTGDSAGRGRHRAGQAAAGDGLSTPSASSRSGRTAATSSSRASRSPRQRECSTRRARSWAARWCWASTITTACRWPRRRASASKLDRGMLDFLEEPIRDETPEAYESLRTMTDVPFAIGEEFASKWQFLPYIERGIHQFNRLDVCNVGGLTEAMKVAGWSEAHYVDLMPHNPLGPDLHGGDGALRGGRAQLRLAGNARRPSESSASTKPSSSRCSRGSRAPSIRSATRRASASRSTRSCSQSRASSSGKRRICGGATARSPTGRRQDRSGGNKHDQDRRHHTAAQAHDRGAQGHRQLRPSPARSAIWASATRTCRHPVRRPRASRSSAPR